MKYLANVLNDIGLEVDSGTSKTLLVSKQLEDTMVLTKGQVEEIFLKLNENTRIQLMDDEDYLWLHRISSLKIYWIEKLEFTSNNLYISNWNIQNWEIKGFIKRDKWLKINPNSTVDDWVDLEANLDLMVEVLWVKSTINKLIRFPWLHFSKDAKNWIKVTRKEWKKRIL